MNKTVVVTGASRGIGLALTQQLLAKGYAVIGTSRTGQVPDISHDNFTASTLDLTDQVSVQSFAQAINDRQAPIHMLINNAGVGPDLNFDRPEVASWDHTFDVNLKGTIFLTDSIQDSIEQNGKILNVSSKMGSIEHCSQSCSPAYRMSKTALNMYTKLLANKLNGKVSVAAIHPGWVQTTISSSGGGRLTPTESATRMMDYIEGRFHHGEFWDAEEGRKLKW